MDWQGSLEKLCWQVRRFLCADQLGEGMLPLTVCIIEGFFSLF